MKPLPFVTVLMPVYNAERHLAEAVESVLCQTHGDFELLCVDDGSQDASPEILARYAAKDSRIRVLHNGENRGIAFSLNRGLREARAELIARMDSDDVSLPDRLALQVAFMTANPDVLVCSGSMTLYETGLRISLPLTDEAIRIRLLWGAPFCHPATMLRRGPVLDAGGYDMDMVPAEDYDLWVRLAAVRGWRFANLTAVLLRYRMYPGMVRGEYKAKQRVKSMMIAEKQLSAIGLARPDLDEDAHTALAGYTPLERVSGKQLANWIEVLIHHNIENGLFSQALFEESVRERMVSVAVAAAWVPLWIKRIAPNGVKQVVKRLLFSDKR